jgi:hypothetical protein
MASASAVSSSTDSTEGELLQAPQINQQANADDTDNDADELEPAQPAQKKKEVLRKFICHLCLLLK